jgi:hypothetical protein
VENARSLRDFINNPEAYHQWWDDDTISEYTDDPESIEHQEYLEALMTQAAREKFHPEEYDRINDAMRLYADREVADGYRSPEEAAQLLKNFADSVKAAHDIQARADRGEFDDPVVKSVHGQLQAQDPQAMKSLQQQVSKTYQATQSPDRTTRMRALDEDAPDPSMRYSGYDEIGRTKQGHKIIRLR